MGFLAWDRYKFLTLSARSDSVMMFLVFIVIGNHILFMT